MTSWWQSLLLLTISDYSRINCRIRYYSIKIMLIPYRQDVSLVSMSNATMRLSSCHFLGALGYVAVTWVTITQSHSYVSLSFSSFSLSLSLSFHLSAAFYQRYRVILSLLFCHSLDKNQREDRERTFSRFSCFCSLAPLFAQNVNYVANVHKSRR